MFVQPGTIPIELDPLYVDTTIRRWQAFTGDLARHAETGRAFRELETELDPQNVE